MFEIIRKQSNIGIGLILWAILTSSLWAGWQKETIFTGSNQIFSLAIGDARNDGKPRIYARVANVGLVELGYSGNGNWSCDTIDALYSFQSVAVSFQNNGGNQVYDLIVGQGQNDGINRIYLFPFNQDSLYEYTYLNGNWIKKAEKISTPMMASLQIASARNDDTMRVYCCNYIDRHAFPDTIYELTWHNGGWDINRIPRLVPCGYLTAGKGRNDDTVRLYIYNEQGGYSYEVTFQGAWFVDSLVPTEGDLGGPPVITKGHNDGLNRFYWESLKVIPVPDTTWCIFHEAVYIDGKWKSEEVFTDPLGFGFSLGVARNDDTNRLYVTGEGNLWEWTCRGNSWTKELAIQDLGGGNLYIEKGRGDDTDRIYAWESSIIEFSRNPKGIGENKNISQETKEQFLITPNPSFKRFKIQYQVPESRISLNIYDAAGKMVRNFLGENESPGTHCIYWDGKDKKGNDAGEGIFFCRLESRGYTVSKKIIRVK